MNISNCCGCFPSIFTKGRDLSKKFPKDSNVQIFGLTTKSEHNGKTGIVVGYNQGANGDNRINVEIEEIEGSKTLSLKPTNLKLVSDESPTTTNPSTYTQPRPVDVSSTTSNIQERIDGASVEEAPNNSLPASESTNNQQLEDLSKIFPINSKVEIKALKDRPAYNGRYATVIEYRKNDEGQDRIIVKVDDEDKSISIKPKILSSEELYKQWKTKCIHDIAKVFFTMIALIHLFRRILTLMKN